MLVSIPGLFGDRARPHLLLGVELNGLWLQSGELTDRLLADDERDLAATAPAVFVPFGQIAGVLVSTAIPQAPAARSSRGRKSTARKGAASETTRAPRSKRASPSRDKSDDTPRGRRKSR